MEQREKEKRLIDELEMGIITDNEFYHKYLTILAGFEFEDFKKAINGLSEENKKIILERLPDNLKNSIIN